VKAAALLLLALLGGCTAPPAAERGVVSLNPCADAMLVALAPARIAALSHYSRDPAATSIALDVARRYPANAGTAEEVIALRPALVVASSFTAPATRSAFERAGLRTLYLDSPASIAASQAQVTQLAAALGVPAAGTRLNARIDAAVEAATTPAPPAPALLWIGGNLVSGGGTLLDELLRRAGFVDAAADYGLQHTGYLPVEHIVVHPPALMLLPDEPGRDRDSRAAQMRARVLAHLARPVPQARFPRRLVNCGGPVIVDALDRLATIRRGLAR
jgi:iron complex transport system substrate-binding protein